MEEDKKYVRHWLKMAMIALLISMSSLYIYDRFYAPKIVTIDIKGYMAEQRALYLSGKIDDVALKMNLEHLQKKIDATPKNKTVITGDVVVSHTEALTP